MKVRYNMTEQEILNNLIEYVTEVKEREDEDEKEFFWTKVIGMTEEQMKKYEII